MHFYKNDVILDCSCSDGQFLNRIHKISPTSILFGIDLSNEAIKKAKTNFPYAHFSKENAERLSFNDSTFNFAFSIMSLHHYQNLDIFLQEMYRILKSNGTLYIVDVIPKNAWNQKNYNWLGCSEPYHFEKYYTVQDLVAIVKTIGFTIAYNHKVSSIPQRIRLLSIRKF
jgi:ubiquinone/menaquinone biosynthesis C-methylase UbiE